MGKSFETRSCQINPAIEKAMPLKMEIGTIDLAAGAYNLNIKPLKIGGTELMKILEIDLIPQ